MEELAEGVRGSRRPHPNLMVYWALESLLLGPFFPLLLLPRFLRYRTLHYELDDEGVTAGWGVLFRREISLTYGRVQDIHLASNLVERWLGLARIQVQTASASAKAELTIAGLRDYEGVRDFLYSRMRGARKLDEGDEDAGESAWRETAAALRETAAVLRELRLGLVASAEEDEP